jgi:hypothetical protein
MSVNVDTEDKVLEVYRNRQAWYGPEIAARSGEWAIRLTADEIRELDAAIDKVLREGIALTNLKQADFPLPSLAPKLAQARKEILRGRGFVLLRGWPAQERAIEQSATAFLGIGSHLGEDLLAQNGRGHVVGHVANLGEDYSDPTTRGHRTSAELKFHVDGGDIVGLLCLRHSRSGGLSQIASSTTIWNELVRRRPDAARLLLRPYTWTRWGEIGDGQGKHFSIPVFQHCDDHAVCVFSISSIEKGQLFEDVPRLTQKEWEALSLVNEYACDPAIHLNMEFLPGDMQFLCNHFIVHSRTAYEDWPDHERRRHLLRMWVSSSDGPMLPDNLSTVMQGATASGRPNGVVVPGVARTAPMDPGG